MNASGNPWTRLTSGTEDKEVKKKLGRVPDVDKDGEPIWKIAEAEGRREEREREKVPPVVRETKERRSG
jgi:hypothetical protein